MSDVPADWRPRLELDELVARIERQQEETRKFVAEQHKLMAEAKKFGRDWWIIPLTVLGGIVAGLLARLPEILHAFGWGAA
jgi:hypothetical protein